MKRKRRLKVNLILGIIVFILVILMIYCAFDIFNSMKSKVANEVEVLDKIEGYDYELNENDPSYFEKLFGDLKDVLESEELDEEEYASLVSQLFVTDFYSLASTINKNDVGGTQFVYAPYQEDFVSKAKTTIYNYVENNMYGDREQELPIVKNVVIDSIETDSYTFDDIIEDENAYIIKMTVDYEKDLEYPTEVTLVLVHNENKLEVAKMES